MGLLKIVRASAIQLCLVTSAMTQNLKTKNGGPGLTKIVEKILQLYKYIYIRTYRYLYIVLCAHFAYFPPNIVKLVNIYIQQYV